MTSADFGSNNSIGSEIVLQDNREKNNKTFLLLWLISQTERWWAS